MNAFGLKLEYVGVGHVYCTDHVLQLTAKLCYEKDGEAFGHQSYIESVKKARAIVTFFNKSSQALEQLHKTCSYQTWKWYRQTPVQHTGAAEINNRSVVLQAK